MLKSKPWIWSYTPLVISVACTELIICAPCKGPHEDLHDLILYQLEFPGQSQGQPYTQQITVIYFLHGLQQIFQAPTSRKWVDGSSCKNASLATCITWPSIDRKISRLTSRPWKVGTGVKEMLSRARGWLPNPLSHTLPSTEPPSNWDSTHPTDIQPI